MPPTCNMCYRRKPAPQRLRRTAIPVQELTREWQRAFCNEFLHDRRVGVTEVLMSSSYLGWAPLRPVVMAHTAHRQKIAKEDHGAHLTIRFHFGELWDEAMQLRMINKVSG